MGNGLGVYVGAGGFVAGAGDSVVGPEESLVAGAAADWVFSTLVGSVVGSNAGTVATYAGWDCEVEDAPHPTANKPQHATTMANTAIGPQVRGMDIQPPIVLQIEAPAWAGEERQVGNMTISASRFFCTGQLRRGDKIQLATGPRQ